MKIIYDNIIFGGQKSGGISVVWYELISRALRDKLDVSFIDFPDNGNIMRNQLGELPDVLRSVPSKYKKIVKYLPVLCSNNKEPFIFHSSFFRYCPSPKAINVTTVHDFTNELYQHGQGALKERWIKNNAIKHSDYIICISENTRKDFEKYYPSFPKDRISVVYNGVSDDFYHSDSLGWPFGFPKTDYVLFVGERSGYKNFDLVVDALKIYDIDLILTGKPLSKDETAALSQIKGKYHHAGRVSTHELNILYNNAYALIYPTAYEGFGLPILEAQKAGCPVIAQNASSIPEVIGDTPLLIDDISSDSIVRKLYFLQNQEARLAIIEEGTHNANRFSWNNMYKTVFSIYNAALEMWKSCRSSPGQP